jgi:phospho-N-acetylmuramoyl-pentapeptide-transferase
MLFQLSYLKELFGPFRLFESYSILISIGLYSGFLISFIFIPRLSKYLPSDQGRLFAIESNKAKGKPTGAGIIFISIFTIISLLIVPLTIELLATIVLTFLTMLLGFFDDKSKTPWNEYKKGLFDLIVALAISIIFMQSDSITIWFPISKLIFTLPSYIFIPMSVMVIWISINITNCSDGVDGLSGTLVLFALITVGIFMYFLIGHIKIAQYLIIPFVKDGARWAITIFIMVGSLIAYLWFNAYPSKILMGDAGSRALGFFMGVTIIKIGNPFLLIIISTILFVNGGTGLVKVTFKRFLKIGIFHNTRFPLHDHMRKNRHWSNTQVLMKFFIMQLLITIGLFGILLKIR